jgi:hypothetical protein
VRSCNATHADGPCPTATTTTPLLDLAHCAAPAVVNSDLFFAVDAIACLYAVALHRAAHSRKRNVARYRLVVYTVSKNVTHMPLAEGATVDVLEVDPSGMCVCRDDSGDVGFYSRANLLTEDEIYQRFIVEEDARLLAELETKKTQDDAKAAECVCVRNPTRGARWQWRLLFCVSA